MNIKAIQNTRGFPNFCLKNSWIFFGPSSHGLGNVEKKLRMWGDGRGGSRAATVYDEGHSIIENNI